MAEKVEIDIPGIGKVKADNAASEATLAEILKILQGLEKKVGGKGSGGGGGTSNKNQKAAEQSARNLAGAANDAAKSTQRATNGSEKFAKSAVIAAHAAGRVVSGFGDIAKSATNLISSLAEMGDSLTSAAGVIGQLPVVGGVLGTVFGAVAKAAEGQLKAYQDMSSIGATFGGSMQDMNRAASSAGLTVEQFANVVKSNGEAMMLLGGTTEAGAKRFAELSKQVRANNEELLRMGYSTEQINSGMAGYLSIIGKTGALQNMSTSQIAASSTGYLKDLDALAKITGQTREEKQKEQEALMKDAQVRAAMASMDAESQKQMMAYITSFPKEQQAAIKDMIATGNITSEEAIKLNALMPGAAQQAMQFGRTLQAGGKISKEAMNQAKNSAIQEAKINTQRYKDQGLYNKDMAETFVGMANLAAQEVDGLSKAYKEGAQAAEKQNLAETLQKSKEKLAAFSNEFTNFLAQSGLLDTLMAAIKGLASFTTTFVIPAFQVVSTVIRGFVGIVTDGVIPVLTSLVSTVMDVAGPAFDFIGKAVSSVADFVSTNLTPILIGVGAALTTYAVTTIPSLIAAAMAQAAATWAVVAPVIAAAAPFIAIAAVVAAAATLFKKMGGDMEVLSDGFKWLWSYLEEFGQGVSLLYYELRDLVSTGSEWKKKAEAEKKAIEETKKKREGLEEKMAKRMQENRDKLDEDEKKREEEKHKAAEAREKKKHQTEMGNIAAKEERDKKAAETAQEVIMSGPEAMLKSAHDLYTGKTATGTPSAGGSTPSTGVTTMSSTGTPIGAQPGKPVPVNDMQKQLMADLQKQGITDPNKIANIMAQVQAESGFKPRSEDVGKYSAKTLFKLYGAGNAGGNKVRFKTMEDAEALVKQGPEAVGNVLYGGRMGNKADEGFKYRGRGLIQLTGKDNYAKYGKMIGVDLVNNPDLANDPAIASQLAVAYFKEKEKKGVNLSDIGAVGKSVGYAGGAAETQKRASLAEGFKTQLASGKLTAAEPRKEPLYNAKMGDQYKSMQTLAADAQAKQKDLPSAASLETAKAALEKGKETLTAAPTTPAAPGTKEPAPKDLTVELLTALNNKMDQLIAISQSTAESSRSQLNAQRDMADSAGILV